MQRDITIHNHPFPFLLYLEWSLLGLAILSELLPEPISRPPQVPQVMLSVATISCILGFGLMGLRIPTQPIGLKLLYTVAEFGFILIVTVVGFPGLRLFPFLYLILVIRGCLMFELMGRLFVAGTTYLMFLALLIYRIQSLRPLRRPPPGLRDGLVFPHFIVNFSFNLVALFGLALIFVLLLVNALLAERRNQEQLVEANQQLRDYALRVENLAMEQERSRIAREIHDSLGHSLTALNIQLEGALKLWQSNPEKAQQFLRASKQLGSTALQDVRHSVSALRTNPLQDKDLPTAIAELAQAHTQTTGITPVLDLDLPDHLSTELQTAIYRITQEALTNIARHAEADQITICIQTTSADIQIAIADNGQGFQPELNTTGFGLQGMRERTLALNGEFHIASQPGKGCQITARLPHI